MASRTPASRGWPVVLVLGVLAGLWGVALLGGSGAGKHTPTDVSSPSPARRAAAPAERPAATEVLHRWDRARARAWAAGDRRALGALYVPGSTAGAGDLALLARYRERGLVVIGMRRQVLAVHVLAGHESEQGSPVLRLQVTDRLVGAVARARDEPGSAGRALPTSRAVTRTVLLRRAGGTPWRMVSVRVDRSAAP